MSSWSQKRLEGGSFPSPVGVPRRAPLYGGGGRNEPHGPAAWVVTCTPATGDADSRGACPPHSASPPPPVLESCLWAGDWFWLWREGQGWSWSLGKPEGWKVGGLGEQGLGSICPGVQAQILGET